MRFWPRGELAARYVEGPRGRGGVGIKRRWDTARCGDWLAARANGDEEGQTVRKWPRENGRQMEDGFALVNGGLWGCLGAGGGRRVTSGHLIGHGADATGSRKLGPEGLSLRVKVTRRRWWGRRAALLFRSRVRRTRGVSSAERGCLEGCGCRDGGVGEGQRRDGGAAAGQQRATALQRRIGDSAS